MTKEKKIAIWLTWLFIWPISFYGLYQYWEPSFQNMMADLFSFAILIGIVALFPLVFKEGPIFLIQGVSLAVFLYFGLFIEVLLTQFGVVFLMIKMRISRQDLYRLPLNMLVFLVTSISGAAIYYLMGGQHGSEAYQTVYDIIPILAYALTTFVSNQILIKLLGLFLMKRPFQWIDRATLWEIYTTLLILPVGFVLYRLYADMGLAAVYYVGIPFAFISAMMMLYYKSRQLNSYLQKTSEIGHELTGRLKESEVMDLFISRLVKLLPIDFTYIYDVIDQEKLKMTRFYKAQQQQNIPQFFLEKGESISGAVLQQRKALQYHRRDQWKKQNREGIPEEGESLISLPVFRNDEIVSVITVVSKEKRAFEKFQYMIVDILSNYLVIAMENAKNYEETKNQSERCPLTNLYNYRYFEEQLEQTFQIQQNINRPLSLILLDIDHFKSVNDTYGHQSGNEVICTLADWLVEMIGEKGVVARYGGEEFVIMLPDYSVEESFQLADEVRRKIASKKIILQEHMLGDKEESLVLTASIGVASYPEHCEQPLELVRHADRAMYMGAKQKGRNKVAVYQSNKALAE